MTGKENQYSWSFRSCLENFKYMVCKYSFSLSSIVTCKEQVVVSALMDSRKRASSTYGAHRRDSSGAGALGLELLSNPIWEASLVRLHKEWMEQCRDQSKRQCRSFQWAWAKGSDYLLHNERQRAACQRILQKAHSSGIWKLPQIPGSSKFSQDYM